MRIKKQTNNNKTFSSMRKILSLFAACIMSALVAFAGEVTINMAEQGYANGDALTTLTVNGITLTFDANGNSNGPKYYDSGTSARLYAKNKLVVSSEQTLTNMVFSLSLNGGKMTLETIEVDGGEAVVDSVTRTLTWTGAAKEVTFTVPSEKLSTGSNPQFRFSSLVVTIDGEVVIPDPVKPEVDFNYGEAVYLNNAMAAEGQPADKPTWELDLAYFTSNTDYTVYFAAIIESEKEDEVAGTYDLAETEAQLEFVAGRDTTFVDLVAGTLTLELVSKEDVSDEGYGDYTVYSYKVTLVATDAEGTEYKYEGTVEEFYYSDMMDYIDDEPQEISVADALEIIESVGSTQTEEQYIVLGYVVKMKYPWDAEHKTATFWMDDTPEESEALQAYAVSPYEESDQNVKVGDFVAVVGPLVKYKNTPEINRGTYQILQIGSGLEIVDANDLVRVIDGQLLVDATAKVEIYNISGQLLYSAQVAGQTTIRGLQQGQVLLVRVGDKIAKVVF